MLSILVTDIISVLEAHIYIYNIMLYSGLVTRNPCYLSSTACRSTTTTLMTRYSHDSVRNDGLDYQMSADEPLSIQYVAVYIFIFEDIITSLTYEKHW